ncbi:MAG TPA: MerR family transcriptional regulator [Pirellulales bacterium]|nr:MerR family transcriptional regulator [Pirellulales bacterium]
METGKLFSIGEFSKITGLTVKTLRFYHEQGLLDPSCVDDQTGYRYYDAAKIEPARVIALLRELEFPLPEIAEILRQCRAEADLFAYLQRHQQTLAAKVEHYRQMEARLEQLIRQHQQARVTMKNSTFEVEEKVVDALWMAGVRMQGRYRDCGQGFSQIGRRLGRYIGGPCFLLHYDDEYKEADANFEACFPLRPEAKNIDAKKTAGISIRQLPGGKCVCLLHKGPYEELGRSYEKILKYMKSKAYNIEMPTREVYLKGPGMIFKGNPRKYLTEIQILIKA